METVVRLRHVTMVYPGAGGTLALNDVNLDIERGEVTLLMGPSGSGKTSLVSVIGGLLTPTSGEVWIADTEISTLDEWRRPAVRRQHIGFVFQTYNVMNALTAEDNVRLGLEIKGVHAGEARETARNLLAMMGLADKCDSLPAELSGGELQRVAIARAVAGNPDIVLADEPTAALDSASGQIVMDKLSALAQQGKAVVVVTHDSRILEYAHRIIRIADGRILGDSRVSPAVAALGSGDPALSEPPARTPARLTEPVVTIETVGLEAPLSRPDVVTPITPRAIERQRRRSPVRWLGAVAALALLGVGIQMFVLRPSTAAPASPAAANALAVPRPRPSVISGAGRVEPASEAVKIGAPIPGRLTEVLVTEGQHLKAGDLIAVLENADVSARVAQAEATVRMRQAELSRLDNGASAPERLTASAAVLEAQTLLDNARADLSERDVLLRSGDISRAEYQRFERQVSLAQVRFARAQADAATVESVARADDRARAVAALDAAQAQLVEARALMGKTMIRAPFDGVVLTRHRRVGELVGAAGEPVVSFGDLSRLVVRVDVDEADVASIRVGDKAYVTAQAFGNRRFSGAVTHIGGQLGRKNIETGDPAEKTDTRILETLVALDANPELPVGLRVDAFIATSPDPAAPAAR